MLDEEAESDVFLSVCPEVPNRQSLLPGQGATDHRAHLPQRPARRHHGEEHTGPHPPCYLLRSSHYVNLRTLSLGSQYH